MDKRTKFIITSVLLTFGFLTIRLLDLQYRFVAIGILGILSILLYAWSLFEGLGFNATLSVLILPFMFTVGVGFFWFLIPSSIFAKLPVLILFTFGTYTLSLTMNIFTVSSIHSIALSRAAKGVGFVMTLLTSFLLFDTVLSIRSEIWINILLNLVITSLLFIQGLWSSMLGKHFNKNILIYSLIFSLGIAQITTLLYFWPVTVVVGSLFLTVAVYVLLGLGQAKLEGRMFQTTVRDYLIIGLVVLSGMFLATIWGG